MKVLVTGSAGFIGSALSLRLLARGDQVIGIDNLNDYYDVGLKQARLARTLNQPGYTDLRLDIQDRAAISAAFAEYQPQRVVNLAAQAGVRYSLIEIPMSYVDTNLTGFANILGGLSPSAASSTWSLPRQQFGLWRQYQAMPFSVHDNVDHPV
jgi:UDP-glucuronate 4-epimerase